MQRYKLKILKDKEERWCILRLSISQEGICIIQYEDNVLREFFKGQTFWEALIKVREYLEKQGEFLQCNGAHANVYPSALILNMGVGELAYHLTLGYPALTKDLVNIFEDTLYPLCCSSVKEQEKFYYTWLDSL